MFHQSGQKHHLPVRAGKLLVLMGGGYTAENRKLRKLGGPIGMVPCLHQGNISIQSKLWVWREQKCIPLVCGKTTLTGVGWQTTPSHVVGISPKTETCVNWGRPTWYCACTNAIFLSKGSYGYGESRNVVH